MLKFFFITLREKNSLIAQTIFPATLHYEKFLDAFLLRRIKCKNNFPENADANVGT